MLPHLLRVLMILCLAVPAATPLRASEGGEGNSSGSMSGRGGASGALNNRTTKRVVRILSRDFRECNDLPEVYRYDCYRFTYKLAVDELIGSTPYDGAREALQQVEETLKATVEQNVDQTKPRQRKGFQTYRAIKPEAVPQAKRQLDRSLVQAETVLLRSADNNAHYQRIAEAVNSNKVLLRSALLWLFGPVILRVI